jgi:hypothetical protein
MTSPVAGGGARAEMRSGAQGQRNSIGEQNRKLLTNDDGSLTERQDYNHHTPTGGPFRRTEDPGGRSDLVVWTRASFARQDRGAGGRRLQRLR